ncbi:MAG: hypothetical protein KDN22_12020 [Verrucomicrobiae bacterium]|nr:hypothetical protein [Verrucomicrobiae bacterium]
MSKKQEFELTWIGKENRPKLEPTAKTPVALPRRSSGREAAVSATTSSLPPGPAKHGGKPWEYRLIPHDTLSENIAIDHLGLT